MSMPQIPEEKYRPTLCEVIIDILKSVALEETALAHILNAEGERSQAMIKKFESCCSGLTSSELDASVRQTEKMLNTIIMKEWLLLRKLETAFEINQKMVCKEKDKDKDDCINCDCKCDSCNDDCAMPGCECDCQANECRCTKKYRR